MYRTFLSWRYLVTRRTNFIGIVGIFVAVAALILILSIMTGFLDQTKAMMRGSLSDLIFTPAQFAQSSTTRQRPADDALQVIGQNEHVRSASARLTWWGMVAQEGDRAHQTMRIVGNAQAGDLSVVQLMGIDVKTVLRQKLPLIRAQMWMHGNDWTPSLFDEYSTTALLEAVEREPHPTRIGARVRDSRYPFAYPPGYQPPEFGVAPPVVLIGEQLFDLLALRRGDELVLATVVLTRGGEVQTIKRTFVVGGSFRTKDNEFDGQRILFPRHALAEWLYDGREYSEIAIALDDYERHGEAAQEDISQQLGKAGLLVLGFDGQPAGSQVRTWEDFRRTLLAAIENERVLMAIMLSLILVVSGFTIFSILTMMVTEKRRDIGILSASGATPRGVMATFLLIGFWNAALGTTLGAIAGVAGAQNIDSIEQTLSRWLGVQIFNRNVYYFDTIPARIVPEAVTAIVIGAFLCTLLFAAVPAWRAARLDPLEALRYE